MIKYVVIGQIGTGKSSYDLLLDENSSKNYSSYVNHSLSVLKQDRETLESNKKSSSSFGSWYSFPFEDLCLIVLSDSAYGDGLALEFLKNLSFELESSFPDLMSNPYGDFDR